MLTCLCRACTFAAWRMCKRSSPGDTPAHVLVSHSWPHFRGASDPPTCEPPALKELAYLLVFAARALLLRGGCVSEAPQATPQPTCWLVTPGHIFVGLVTHPRVSHLHLRGSHAYSLFAARALLLRGGCCVRARCYLGGRAGRMDGRLTFFWSVCISAVTHAFTNSDQPVRRSGMPPCPHCSSPASNDQRD